MFPKYIIIRRYILKFLVLLKTLIPSDPMVIYDISSDKMVLKNNIIMSLSWYSLWNELRSVLPLLAGYDPSIYKYL